MQSERRKSTKTKLLGAFLSPMSFEHSITMIPSCLIPRFDGAICSLKWKEALWDRYVTAAHAIRAAIQRSQATTAALSRELGINVKTVAKWRKRETVEDRKLVQRTPVPRF